MKTGKWLVGLVWVCSSMTGLADGTREMTATEYRDSAAGMWLGELLGNYAGRQVEGKTTVSWEGPTAVSKSITQYQVQWNTILTGQYYDSSGALRGNVTKWLGDDDTAPEFLYTHQLQSSATLSAAERTALWTSKISSSGLYFSNRQAWYQTRNHGQTADMAGTVGRNITASWTIDAQIDTEALGAVAVGMRNQSASLTGDFAGMVNQGYAVHAAQFYAAMYAEAPFQSDVATLVTKGLEVVAQGSWTREIIEQAQSSFAADLADDGSLNDWLGSRAAVSALARSRGRYRMWTESAMNTGMTALAILYGQGDFVDTVEYGVRGGYDSDCNPATAGGLIGMMKGESGIVADIETAGYSVASIPQTYNDSATVILAKSDWTLEEVTDLFQAAAETQILAAGGEVVDGVYTIPNVAVVTGSVVIPTGPRGLVGAVLAEGQSVSVVVRQNDVVVADGATKDRTDQSLLIDGMSDVTETGVLPFWTSAGSGDPQTDAYELHFDQEVQFTSLIMHEGDAYYSAYSMGPSRDPAETGNYEPRGGYFDSLTVEVLQGENWVEVSNLGLSESLEALVYFQSIELTFDKIEGDAIRIIGNAGGSQAFTSLTELEAFGVIPEPATMSLLALGGIAMLRRRRNRA
jgi:hypothetical protein